MSHPRNSTNNTNDSNQYKAIKTDCPNCFNDKLSPKQNPLKLARCIQELERIKGVRVGKGGDRKSMDKMSIDTPQITQEDIAKQFGVSVKKVDLKLGQIVLVLILNK